MAWRGCFMKRAKINSLYTQFLSPKSSRLTIHPQQRCGFKKAQRQSETKRGLQEETEAGQKHVVSPLPGEQVPPKPLPPRKPHRLFRPLVFTVGFTGCSFGTAAILQYESVKSRVQMAMEEAKEEKRDKLGEGHNTTYWHNWWNQLSHFQKQVILVMSVVDDWWSGLSEGQKTVTGIIALNTLVLCCWRIPSMQRSLVKYFTSNPASKTRCLPMVLSSFSHYSIIHMVTNMYVLWTFSSSIVSLLGREQFLALYLSGGVISTFVSYVFKTATGRLGPSLGASGAIMTVLAAVCTKTPEAKLGILLLPMVSFTAGNALKALVALDTAGLLLGWRFFDHAAHLGGALFGVWYIAYGNEMIWRNREPLVRLWHELRNKPNGRPRPGGGGQV
ncbi:presenilins-associated rhomboid-like protein, mitochondrial [Pimephales promelas]|uniref:presenilins-associated rhomboid-like protein, mitochondrial n=1 Tax=Pimephales promelas TaxID=90988 RepID=UPI0019556CEE|nr:presenilins-associated rhomboid-like protein, mitochondrial [Pimephales promelas]KAG1937821.1 presenilins-associated rhomboid-like protein, mitochondrial [Pimephales promelas]